MLIPKSPTPDMCAGGVGGIPTIPLAIGGLAVAGLVAFLALR